MVGVSVGGPGVVGSVADSRVSVLGSNANGLHAYTGAIVNARNLTLIGEGGNYGAYAAQSLAGTATLNLQSSTVSGFSRELIAAQSNGGNAHLNVSYSNYDDVEESGGGDIIGGGGNVNVTPGFVVPFETFTLSPDYHLLDSSPLSTRASPPPRRRAPSTSTGWRARSMAMGPGGRAATSAPTSTSAARRRPCSTAPPPAGPASNWPSTRMGRRTRIPATV